jgi:hypothetical protein
MRQGMFRRRFKFAASALLAMAVLAPSALGASPGGIYEDLADGRLDGSYTRAELEAYARDAAVQGYGNPVVTGVAGAQAGGDQGGNAPVEDSLAQTGSAGTLPFTGTELGLFALVGGALLVGGVLLRRSARVGRNETTV